MLLACYTWYTFIQRGNIRMDRSSQHLVHLIIIVVLVAIIFTFWRTMVMKDFLIINDLEEVDTEIEA